MFLILCHLVGDYILQTDHMAVEKTKKFSIAILHAVSYSIPFMVVFCLLGIPLTKQAVILTIIAGSHAVIDRYRIARYICWAKNLMSPKKYRYSWSMCTDTGYHNNRPAWLTVWLMIITDNTLHLVINALAVKYLV